MKRLPIIVVCLVAIVFGLTLLVAWQRRKALEPPPVPPRWAQESNASSAANAAVLPPGPSYGSNWQAAYSNWFRVASTKDPLVEWRTPLDFWGVVLDHDTGLPLGGVQASFTWTDDSRSGNGQAALMSDLNGKFALLGKHGKRLLMEVGKPGYYWVYGHSTGTYEYSTPWDGGPYRGDPTRPEVFRLKQAGKLELLWVLPLSLHRPKPDKPVVLELDRIKLQTNGQLRVERETTNSPVLRITLLDGGLRATDELFPFLAPEEGYSQTVEVPVPVGQTGVTHVYYRRGDPLRYGRIELRREGGDLTLLINPAGSRILEYPQGMNPLRVPDNAVHSSPTSSSSILEYVDQFTFRP